MQAMMVDNNNKENRENEARGRYYNKRKGSCNSSNTETTINSNSSFSSSTINSKSGSRRFLTGLKGSNNHHTVIPPSLDEEETTLAQEIEELKSTHAQEIQQLQYKLKQREDSIASLEGALKISQMTMEGFREGVKSEVQLLKKQLLNANFQIRELQKQKEEHQQERNISEEATTTPLRERVSKSYHTRSKVFTSYESQRKSYSRHKTASTILTCNGGGKTYARSISYHDRTCSSPPNTKATSTTHNGIDADKKIHRQSHSHDKTTTYFESNSFIKSSSGSSVHDRREDEMINKAIQDRSARRSARRGKNMRNCKSLHARSSNTNNNADQPNHYGEDLVARREIKANSEPLRRRSDLSAPLHSLISDFCAETKHIVRHQRSPRQKKSTA
mmetsp:Transcript_18764/g.27742  ORF Transcript_18764/g.27742 Transcript_18764/m.27742 type:complete len:389 (-) Transcript_18764:160-1326(-)